jgi:hypothetical protein
VYRVTELQTGVSGITALSPAMSIAAQSGDMMFSVYTNDRYTGFALPADSVQGTPLSRDGELDAQAEADVEPAVPDAAILPPVGAIDEGIVASYLDDPLGGLPDASVEYDAREYSPKLSLESIAPPSVGVSTGGFLGTSVSGGVGLRFGDMLGNQSLSVVLQAQGRIRDIGGQVSYLNQQNRFNWGGSAGHIPIVFNGGIAVGPGREGAPATLNQVIQRLFIDQVSVGGSYPFNTRRRVELNVGAVRYGFGTQIESFLFDPRTGATLPAEDDLSPEDPNFPDPDPLYLGQASTAYVVDYSRFGLTSPVGGARYRFQLTGRAGTESFVTGLADVRRYFYLRPFTFAMHGLHIGNYGIEVQSDGLASDLFAQEFIGFPYSRGFVRGYNINNFDPNECTPSAESTCPELSRLIGSRIAKASVEFRVPLLGPDRISLIPFQYLPTEVSLFADGGVAWTGNDLPTLEFSTDSAERVPVFSTGIAARFNVLGALILETYWAYPFQRKNPSGQWGLRFTPGW